MSILDSLPTSLIEVPLRIKVCDCDDACTARADAFLQAILDSAHGDMLLSPPFNKWWTHDNDDNRQLYQPLIPNMKEWMASLIYHRRGKTVYWSIMEEAELPSVLKNRMILGTVFELVGPDVCDDYDINFVEISGKPQVVIRLYFTPTVNDS